MTKQENKNRYQTLYSHFFLINKDGKTLLAASHRRPVAGFPVLCFLPILNDFFKLDASKVVATIKQKKYCNWCERLLTNEEVRYCTAIDCNNRNKDFQQ